ncbi:MAG: thioredoxin [Deltaproteobacteria bacterium]|nr:thioredoxin [Deltaproteobacteria bacterium]
MANESVLAFTDANFENEVLKSDKPVLVDFWAVWCAPCRAVAPIIDEMASDYEGSVKVGKVNVDENQIIPSKYGVRGIPTVILFNNGKVVDQLVGAAPKTAFKQMVEKAVAR